MESHLVQELKAQLDDHDEVVVVDEDDEILDVTEVRFDSRNGRVEIQVKTKRVD